MVANLENTVRKWRAVYNALRKWSRIIGRGGSFVLNKNAPAVSAMYNNYNKSHEEVNFNGNLQTNQQAYNYFEAHPNRRKYINNAYNHLNNANKQLNSVARKIVAARKIQEVRRKFVKNRNKKEKNNTMRSAFLVTRHLPRNMARTELLGKIYHNLHLSKTPYGPFRPRMAKYPTY